MKPCRPDRSGISVGKLAWSPDHCFPAPALAAQQNASPQNTAQRSSTMTAARLASSERTWIWSTKPRRIRCWRLIQGKLVNIFPYLIPGTNLAGHRCKPNRWVVTLMDVRTLGSLQDGRYQWRCDCLKPGKVQPCRGCDVVKSLPIEQQLYSLGNSNWVFSWENLSSNSCNVS